MQDISMVSKESLTSIKKRQRWMKNRNSRFVIITFICLFMIPTSLVKSETIIDNKEEVIIEAAVPANILRSTPTTISSDGEESTHHDLIVPFHAEREVAKHKIDSYKKKRDTEVSEGTPDTPLKDTGSYSSVYKGVALLILAFLAGEASVVLGLPHYVGAIILGVILGPQMAKVFPEPVGALTASGWVGIALLFFNFGVEWDHSKVRMAGISAVLFSLLGALVTFATFVGLGKAFGLSNPRSAVFAATFVPTSISCLVRSFYQQGLINTPFYQYLFGITSIDDIFGILIIPFMTVVARDHPANIDYLYTILSFFGFFSLTYIVMLTRIPNLLIEKGFRATCSNHHVEIATVCLACITLLGMMPLLQISKSHYLVGAFLAGLIFSNTPLSTYHYSSVGKYLVQFLTRIFYVTTVGLMMPVKELKNDPSLIGWAILFFIGTFTKAILGFISIPISKPTLTPDNFPYNTTVIKSASVAFVLCCRGELTIILSTFALNCGIMSSKTYIAVILTVFFGVIPAPFLFETAAREIISRSKEYLKDVSPENFERQGDESTPLFLVIQIRSRAVLDYHLRLRNTLCNLNLFVHDHRMWYPKDLNPIVVTEIYATDTKTRLNVPQNIDIPLGKSYLENEIAIERCKFIQEKLVRQLNYSLSDLKINVMQWVPGVYEEINLNHDFNSSIELDKSEKAKSNDAKEGLSAEQNTSMEWKADDSEAGLTEFQGTRSDDSHSSSSEAISYESFTRLHRSNRFEAALAHERHSSLIQSTALYKPKVSGPSLWFTDSISQEAAMTSSERVVTYYDQTFGRSLGLNSAYTPYLRLDVEFKLPVEDRLAGIVREIRTNAS